VPPGHTLDRGAAREPPARSGSRWRRRIPWSPGRIVLAYALVAIAWVVLSDRVLDAAVDGRASGWLQTLKGGGFVAVTSCCLFVLIRRRDRMVRRMASEVRATIESMGDGVLIVDGRRDVVEANQAAGDLLGVPPEELLGPLGAWVERFELRTTAGEPLALAQLASSRALAGERGVTLSAILRRPDGRDVFVAISSSPVVETEDRAELAVTTLRDVSAARRLDELRDDFLSTAAHELKTPLAVVKAYAQLLQRRVPAEAQALLVIERQVNRLTRLVQHLLDTTRLELDAHGRPRERFDLGRLARDVIERTRASAPRHAFTLEAARAPVVGDRERLERVIDSLVENAVRFSPDGGAIDTRVEVLDGAVVFSVQDTGLGIPAERQARVFERHYRAHAGRPDDYGGLGLGLDMSREIVARHGGRMWFESEAGRGSTFHFSVPADGDAS
jgi:PAS domain S-box-containing protein